MMYINTTDIINKQLDPHGLHPNAIGMNYYKSVYYLFYKENITIEIPLEDLDNIDIEYVKKRLKILKATEDLINL